MTRHLHDFLDALQDTREIVVRRPQAEPGLNEAWREARDEAADAFARWATTGGREAYAVYLAAADRADAAAAALATELAL
jgi:hypothetical protein